MLHLALQIHARGGAHWVTSWGKFWLAVLGVHSWDGLNPMPPEMWLLPFSKLSGIGYMHPGRFWCHCRMVGVTVALPMYAWVVTSDVPLRCTVRYGNTAYSRIYLVLDRIYGKIQYGVRYGPNFESISKKIKIELCFSSANS